MCAQRVWRGRIYGAFGEAGMGYARSAAGVDWRVVLIDTGLDYDNGRTHFLFALMAGRFVTKDFGSRWKSCEKNNC